MASLGSEKSSRGGINRNPQLTTDQGTPNRILLFVSQNLRETGSGSDLGTMPVLLASLSVGMVFAKCIRAR